MRFGFYAGETDKTIYLRLRDSTTGLAKTGLAFNSAGAVCSYVLPLAARVAITLATQTVTGAHTDGGFVEVDATNCKGLYRLDLPDAAIASGSFSVVSIEFDGTIEESIELEIDRQGVNVVQVSGDSTAADTLELFAEALDQSTGQLDSGSFAASAIDAAALAADAAIEIRNAITGGAYALSTDANGRVRIVDGTGAGELETSSGTVTMGNISNGTITAASIATGAIDADALATDAVSEIADAVWEESLADHEGTVGSTAEALADAGGSGASAADIADAVWDEAASGHTTAGTFGKAVADVLADTDELQTNQGDWATATGFSTHSAADVWSSGTRTLTALGFTLDSDDTDASLISEIQAAITGGAYTLDTDANGAIRIVDGTGSRELNTSGGFIAGIAGTINTLDALDTAQDVEHDATQAAIAALNNISVANVLTTQMTEAYAANGVAPTLAQALFAIHQKLMARQYAGLTSPVLKLDGVTEAFQGELDDATNPTEDIRVPA